MFYWNLFLFVTFFYFISTHQSMYADSNIFPLSDADEATIQNDLSFLTNGVNAFELPDTPGNINVFSKFAYILASTNSVNVWAAGRLGSGKVCAFTSNKWCKTGTSTQPLDNGKVMQNCINWISNNTSGSLPASSVVGMITPEMTYSLGFTKSSKKTFQTAADLLDITFVVIHEKLFWTLTQSQINVLSGYIKGGGGLVACSAPWDRSIKDMPINPANVLLLEAGIRWTTESDSSRASVTVNNVHLRDWWTINPWYTANMLYKAITLSAINEKTTIQGDIKFLTNGITTIQLESRPASLIAFGEYSYMLANTPTTPSNGTAVGTAGVNVWGAGRLGSGKVCAFSANMFCKMGSSPPLDNGKVMQNCINWVSNNTAGSLPATSIVGMITPEMTYTKGFTVSSKKTFKTAADLADIQFVVVHEDLLLNMTKSQLDVLARYVKGGGGLIACSAPWDQYEEDMPTHPINILLAEAGLRWSTYSDKRYPLVTLNKDQPSEWWKTNPYYGTNIIAQVTNISSLPDVATVLSTYASLLSFMSYYKLSEALRTCAQIVGVSKIIDLVCDKKFTFPIYRSSTPIEYACVNLVHMFRYFLPLNENHPIVEAASIVPGYPSGCRQTETVQVIFSLTHRRWLSSGFFIWPGSYLNVTVPDSLLNKSFEIQIGAQSDILWKKDFFRRWPDIIDHVELTQNSFSFFTFGGGPLYLNVPVDGLTYGIKNVTISLTGQIVKHPWFKLGRDSESNWASMLTSNTAPLGEVESDYMVVTVDATMLKTVLNVTALALWYNSILLNYYDLRGNKINNFKQRFVVDLQISVGGAHAGYPIMLDDGLYSPNFEYTKCLLWSMSNVKITNQYQTNTTYWGIFHEIGHNWQINAWTPNGEGEVTNNIFALYNEEIYPDGPHEFGYKNYSPGVTISGPFAILQFYIDLRHSFGWEAFRQFFRKFETNADLGALGSDQAIDNWLQYFSQTVKRDITSLMDTYKKPYSASAKQAASQYPAWNVTFIIDCHTAAFPTSPCMTVSGKTTTSYSFKLVLWSRINYTEALEIRFVGPLTYITGIVEKGTKLWEKTAYNSSAQTLRLQPYKRMNAEDKISFSVTTAPGFKFTEVWVKIVDVATSTVLHVAERRLESIIS